MTMKNMHKRMFYKHYFTISITSVFQIPSCTRPCTLDPGLLPAFGRQPGLVEALR